ncbi:hypothetical protein MNB_SM-7-1280 [hydrothermal vent metagenome]|uniref:DUF481 domain-containing protein n=1 Tax=hydrothermal vent metagenome TaxID=652676 RepID=A0A1W1BGE0_9ZZZZ
MKKIAFVSLALSSLLLAQEGGTDLTTHTQLGYIATKGNTHTESFSFDTNWKKEFGKNAIAWQFSAQYGKAEDTTGEYTTNKNKFFTELDYDYSLSSRFAVSYLAGYKHDKFSSYRYQFYTGPGAKYKAIKTTAHDLSVEGSVLYSRDEFIADNSTNDYTSLQAKAIYNYQMTESLKFSQVLSYRVDVEDVDTYFIYSDSSLLAKISDTLSAGFGYKVDYVNQPGDKDHTDQTLLATLSIDY